MKTRKKVSQLSLALNKRDPAKRIIELNQFRFFGGPISFEQSEKELYELVKSGAIKRHKGFGRAKISILEDYFSLPQNYKANICKSCGHVTYKEIKKNE